MKPTQPINITKNPNWRYTPSEKTDVAATIRRWKREQEAARKASLDTVIKMKARA